VPDYSDLKSSAPRAVVAPFALYLVVMAVAIPVPVRGNPRTVPMGRVIPAAADPDIMARGAVPVAAYPDIVRARRHADDDLRPRGRGRSVDLDVK
jgi:hypothetical protein